jgi:hypothetical protein
MRRIRIAAVRVMVAAGLVGAMAAPASAAKPNNYGTCVSNDIVDPAQSEDGPLNSRAINPVFGLFGGVFIGVVQSDFKPRFTGGTGCAGND